MEEDIGVVPNEVLVRESILEPETARQFDELHDKTMDSKILTELTELKDSISKVKDIFKTDIVTMGQKILDKINLDIYEFTDEEKQVKKEIEDIMEFVTCIMDEFYQYDEMI
jgi:hypothetical protein